MHKTQSVTDMELLPVVEVLVHMTAMVIRLTQLAPISLAGLEGALGGIKHVIVAEESSGGIHEALAWQLRDDHHVDSIDLGNEFVTHGSIAQLHRQFGMDPASIARKIKEVLENEN